MDHQDSRDASEVVQYSRVDIPQCEVVIEETESSSFDEMSETESNMVTYVVIPGDMDPEQIIINYCEPSTDEDIIELQNQCILCGETFKNCIILQEHFSSVHVTADLTCQVCRLQCTTDLQLMRHYNKHKYSCNLCEASFGKYEDLFNHKKTHSQTLPYACNICNEAYSSTREISLHIREKHIQKRALETVEGNKSKKVAGIGIVQMIKEETT
ncbi:hypothetical protein HHI36_019006 [Cryptolaemus montrouzieri]|uniref:C2H2-type domain-containing protein n=1 Tax=Cryptolaemus montrouzieri TaxID=559131 RepID=A0ABD2P1N9_9CUCU